MFEALNAMGSVILDPYLLALIFATTILGVIMYLRTGQVVGNAGLLGALLIILLAHVITISTGLAVSSVATKLGYSDSKTLCQGHEYLPERGGQ